MSQKALPLSKAKSKRDYYIPLEFTKQLMRTLKLDISLVEKKDQIKKIYDSYKKDQKDRMKYSFHAPDRKDFEQHLTNLIKQKFKAHNHQYKNQNQEDEWETASQSETQSQEQSQSDWESYSQEQILDENVQSSSPKQKDVEQRKADKSKSKLLEISNKQNQKEIKKVKKNAKNKKNKSTIMKRKLNLPQSLYKNQFESLKFHPCFVKPSLLTNGFKSIEKSIFDWSIDFMRASKNLMQKRRSLMHRWILPFYRNPQLASIIRQILSNEHNLARREINSLKKLDAIASGKLQNYFFKQACK